MSETMTGARPKEKPRPNRRKDKKEKTSQVVKIVIRHLPPTMTESEFVDQVGPFPDSDSYYYCQPDWSLGLDATCRAYINMSMTDMTEILQFRDRFDGYIFVDNKGDEYMAIVEYAPFQCFLKNKARNDDSKVNTIESEPHYQEFLQRMADEREEVRREVKIDFNFDRRAEEVKTTPLLQYLANKKEKRREEARKKNEEKRKQREEQKQVRLADQADTSKTKETAGGGGDNKKPAGNIAKKDGKDPPASSAQSNEAVKTSRSKRRTERDQRRREEHEQRKLAKRDNKKNEPQGKEEKGKAPGAKQNISAKPSELLKADKEIVILKKESKPDPIDLDELPTTSKAAEKARAENREAIKGFATDMDELPSTSKAAERARAENRETIKAFATDRDDMPSTSKAAERARAEQRGSLEVVGIDMDELPSTSKAAERARAENREAPEAVKIFTRVAGGQKDKETSRKAQVAVTFQDAAAEEAIKAAQFRASEERRIRNKDRPSIAIYQPKARNRGSDELPQSVGGKDASDGEGSVVEEKTTKKNKRSNRRNKSKPKEVKAGPQEAQSFPKSSESGNSVK